MDPTESPLRPWSSSCLHNLGANITTLSAGQEATLLLSLSVKGFVGCYNTLKIIKFELISWLSLIGLLQRNNQAKWWSLQACWWEWSFALRSMIIRPCWAVYIENILRQSTWVCATAGLGSESSEWAQSNGSTSTCKDSGGSGNVGAPHIFFSKAVNQK